MTSMNDTKSKARLSAKLAAGLAISAALVFGTLAAAPVTRAEGITTTIVEMTAMPGTPLTIVRPQSSTVVTMVVVTDITPRPWFTART